MGCEYFSEKMKGKSITGAGCASGSKFTFLYQNTPVSQTHARSEICVGKGLPRSSSRGASWKANFAWGLRGD